MNELELHAWREGYRLGYYQGVRDGSSEAHKLTADEQARRIAEGMTTAEQQQLNLSGEKAQGAWPITRPARPRRKP